MPPPFRPQPADPDYAPYTDSVIVRGRSGPYRQRSGPRQVIYDPATGRILPPGSHPGHLPPGMIWDPDNPGMAMIPGDPGGTDPFFPGRGGSRPATPAQTNIPVPGRVPGSRPPAGSVPGPEPGTHIFPGTAGSPGDARGIGRTPPTAAQGPFPNPVDFSEFDYGVPEPPQYPPGHPQAIFQDISPFPTPPTEDFVRQYHDDYASGRISPTHVDPQVMFDYTRPTASEAGFSEKRGAEIAEERMTESFYRNKVHPWMDQAIFLGMADLVQGLTPTTVHVPAQPPVVRTFPGSNIPLPNLLDPGKPLMTKGTPATTEMGLPPLLNPANYPSGGGGGIPGIPPLSDILGDIGDALFPSLGAPQDPSAPPMSRNLPPTGGY